MRTPSAPAATKIRALASPPDQIFVSPIPNRDGAVRPIVGNVVAGDPTPRTSPTISTPRDIHSPADHPHTGGGYARAEVVFALSEMSVPIRCSRIACRPPTRRMSRLSPRAAGSICFDRVGRGRRKTESRRRFAWPRVRLARRTVEESSSSVGERTAASATLSGSGDCEAIGEVSRPDEHFFVGQRRRGWLAELVVQSGSLRV